MKHKTKPAPRTFSQQLREKEDRRAWNLCSLYAMMIGFTGFAVFGVRALCAVGLPYALDLLLAAAALVLACCGLFCPLRLQGLAHVLRRVLNRIAKCVLQLLLLPIYALLCLLSGAQRSKTQANRAYAQWDSAEARPTPCYRAYSEHTFTSEKNSVFRIVNRVLLFFSENGMRILLPLILLLLLVGAFFFILSTESVFAFLYALF